MNNGESTNQCEQPFGRTEEESKFYIVIFQSFRGYYVTDRINLEKWDGLMQDNLISEEIDWALLLDERGVTRRRFRRGSEPESWNDPVDEKWGQ